MKKGTVLPFLLLLASAALILGAFFLLGNKPKTPNQNSTQTQSPPPTDKTDYTEATETVYTDEGSANWKTYTSTKYGWSIKYPPDFTFKEREGVEGMASVNRKFDFVNFKNYNDQNWNTKSDATSISISSLYTNENISNLKSWLEKETVGYTIAGTIGQRIRNISQIKINGLDAVVYLDGQESTYKNVAIHKDKKLIIITHIPTSETGGSYDEKKAAVEYFDQILSTFKFVE